MILHASAFNTPTIPAFYLLRYTQVGFFYEHNTSQPVFILKDSDLERYVREHNALPTMATTGLARYTFDLNQFKDQTFAAFEQKIQTQDPIIKKILEQFTKYLIYKKRE